MEINVPTTSHIVHDYDIVFLSGMALPFTINLDLGDTIEFNDATILIHLAEKPSPIDPAQVVPANDTTVFIAHVAAVQHHTRKVKDLTPDQKFDLEQAWKDLPTFPTLQ